LEGLSQRGRAERVEGWKISANQLVSPTNQAKLPSGPKYQQGTSECITPNVSTGDLPLLHPSPHPAAHKWRGSEGLEGRSQRGRVEWVEGIKG
jgi:hypothetical protein